MKTNIFPARSNMHTQQRWQLGSRDLGPAPNLIPLIIDAALPDGPAGSSGVSLLSLPLGAGSVLDHLLDRLARVTPAKVLVLTDLSRPDRNGNGRAIMSRAGIAVQHLSPAGFPEAMAALESSDHLLIVDPRCWPTSDYDFESMVRCACGYRGAIHAIAVGSLAGGAWEQVDLDAEGRISRVQRLYDHMSWPAVADAAILCSLVPARLVGQKPPQSLACLRKELVARGALSQDLPVLSGVEDLGQVSGILALSERMLEPVLADARAWGLRQHSPGVAVAAECRIDPSARLTPPIILQRGATIEKGAVVVGPTVVGPRARIGPGAVVAGSLLCADAVVAGGSVASESVIDPRWTGTAGPASACPMELPSSKARIDCNVFDCSTAVMLQKRRWLHFAIKRFMDVSLSLLALVVLSPLLVALALLVKLTSKGPVFFIHRRETIGGREFPCLKFRTMRSDAHRLQRDLLRKNLVDGPHFKLKQDPRITPIGGLLRRTNLDELPQLINVLLGQMSLIGPRPSPFRENQICVPWRKARLLVRPGITGLWQLCRNADRSNGGFHEWIFYDLIYVRDFSIWLDLKILWATLLTMGKRQVPLSKLVKVPQEFASAVSRS